MKRKETREREAEEKEVEEEEREEVLSEIIPRPKCDKPSKEALGVTLKLYTLMPVQYFKRWHFYEEFHLKATQLRKCMPM